MIFHIFGHPNVLGEHYNTIEFTKDSELSKEGDCILGVKADFDPNTLRYILKNFDRAKVVIKANNIKDEVDIILNKDFDDSHEIVLRRSEYSSKRTLGFRATKAAKDIDRRIIAHLKSPGAVAEVEVIGL